ncbi:MAG TPA: hypothetical protein VGZ73_08005 [Bryobacteraceae bacterium]|nr:hypothetical protein [Bryobacteraceae bacterium]
MRLRLVTALFLLPPCACAVELHLQFGALERMLAEQLFTQDGRRYVHGNQKTRCNFAYLERPRIHGDAGRLRIHAEFTGRSAMNVFGQCVGMGDAFDLTILATPQFRDGNVGLKDVTVVSDGKSSFYIRRVCASIAASLGRDFHYPMASETQKLLEDPGAHPGYKRDLRNFDVTEVRVTEDALVLVIDFQLTVR